MTQQCFTWGDADFTWNSNEYTWNDVCLVIEIMTGGNSYYNNFQKLPKEKKEQVITLICNIKGEEIKQTKKKKKYVVSAYDINLLINDVFRDVTIDLKKTD